MLKPVLIAGVVLILALQGYSQPQTTSRDVTFRFSVTDARQLFRLWELIPVKFSYSSDKQNTYFWVQHPAKLEGGRSIEISCTPSAEKPKTSAVEVNIENFHRMLAGPCGGIGGGIGGGCGDCDGETALGPNPVGFGTVPLNKYIRFRAAGTYRCQASSAEITSARRDEMIRPALLTESNSVTLTIVDDPSWARAAVSEYADAYDKDCRGDDVATKRFLQCSNLARRIRYIETPEALAAEVKRFDGRSHGWDNGFWDAIRRSSFQGEALRLMKSRIQDPDFLVDASTVDWLAASELNLEDSSAFQGDATEHYQQAIDKRRDMVRLLGSSLSKKSPDARSESVKTYLQFAEEKDCEQRSLIPEGERKTVLATMENVAKQ